MTVATSDFRDTLTRSGLVTQDQLDRFLAQSLVAPDEAEALAAALVGARLLTPWQRDKLLDGRFKGFFLGRYRLLSQLGAGNMGAVYLAEHTVMRHKVALKVVNQQLSQQERYLARFELEARAAATVHHPRVVRAFDYDNEGGVQYLVMEYVEGEDLQKIVVRDGVLPIPVAAECARQAAEGLAAIHEAGLVHRDIKPSNLLIDAAGDVRILDLGLARLEDSDAPSLTLMHNTKMIGTVDYLSPEQARNSHQIDHRADLYSLGCTLYFLLCGEPPFNEGSLTQRVIEHQTKPPVDIRQKRRDCPVGLAAICRKLLAKLPEERYQSAGEVIDALDGWLAKHEARLPMSSSSLGILRPAAAKIDLHDTHTPGSSDTNAASVSDELQLADDPQGVSPPERAREPARAATGPSRPIPSSRDPQPVLESLAPLASLDMLDGLPEISTPALGSAPLATVKSSAPHADDNPLGYSAAAAIYRQAVAEARSQPRTSAWDKFQSLFIVEDGPAGVSYALWFLIASGLVLGLIVCLVGYSYMQSTRPANVIEHRRSEGGRE